ncbi:3411_t:CDS:1, partial [Funneliformis geosporum]
LESFLLWLSSLKNTPPHTSNSTLVPSSNHPVSVKEDPPASKGSSFSAQTSGAWSRT